jgi:type IV secretion system protein VirD4
MPGDTRGRPVRSPPHLHADRPLVALLAIGLLVAAWAGTQYVAWRLAFPPSLGAPLVVPDARERELLRALAVLAMGSALAVLCVAQLRGLCVPLLLLGLSSALASLGPLYAPHAIVVWYAANAQVTAAASIFRIGWILVGGLAVLVSLTLASAGRRGRRVALSDSHGSAYWGDGESLHRDAGLLLGRQGARVLRYGGEGHVLTVAPTRSGKGVSCVIPNLLDHPGSLLVTDPKGENFAVTARWRREIGQTVAAFDPFGVVADPGSRASYNPLDLVDATSSDAIDDARMLADMIVLPEGRGGGEQTFWNEEARGVLAGLILHVAANAPPESRTLTHVRTLLTLAPEPFALLLEDMQASPAADGLVSRAAARLLQKADKERSGVISTAQSHTHFLDSPHMARVLGGTTVDLAILKRGGASIYLVLPTDRLDAYARWLRLMIACALLGVARTRGQPRQRLLCLLDEFAHLGRMHPVQRDIGLAGGFGVSFWLVVQDLSQLRSAYGDGWHTFLANVDVLQAFGTNDWDTAEYLSKMTGEATIHVESENASRSVSRGEHPHRQLGAAVSTSEKGRRLLLPDEVRRLPSAAELLFVKGSAPLLVERIDYLRDRVLAARADPNPLHAALVDAAR